MGYWALSVVDSNPPQVRRGQNEMRGHHRSVEQLSFQHAPQNQGLKRIREQTTPLVTEHPVRLDIHCQKGTSEMLAPHCLHCTVFVLQRKHFTSINCHICSWAIYSFSLPGINPEPLVYCVTESWGRSSWRVSKLSWQSQQQEAQIPTASVCSESRHISAPQTDPLHADLCRAKISSAWQHTMGRTGFSTGDVLHPTGLNCSHLIITNSKL